MTRWLVPLALLAASCATIPTVDSAGAKRAGFGGKARIGAVSITPKHIVEDSRCPIDVQCVWAGRVLLAVSIAGRGWTERATLELGKPQALRGMRLVLADVTPARRSTAGIRPGDYKFTFEAR